MQGRDSGTFNAAKDKQLNLRAVRPIIVEVTIDQMKGESRDDFAANYFGKELQNIPLFPTSKKICHWTGENEQGECCCSQGADGSNFGMSGDIKGFS